MPECLEALSVYKDMLDFGHVPDNFTYIDWSDWRAVQGGLCGQAFTVFQEMERNALTRHVEVEPETFCKCWMRSSPARRVSLQAEVYFISLSKEICLRTTCVWELQFCIVTLQELKGIWRFCSTCTWDKEYNGGHFVGDTSFEWQHLCGETLPRIRISGVEGTQGVHRVHFSIDICMILRWYLCGACLIPAWYSVAMSILPDQRQPVWAPCGTALILGKSSGRISVINSCSPLATDDLWSCCWGSEFFLYREGPGGG